MGDSPTREGPRHATGWAATINKPALLAFNLKILFGVIKNFKETCFDDQNYSICNPEKKKMWHSEGEIKNDRLLRVI